MAKRFIDTTIWTQNKWFRKLKPKDKLLWFYLFSNCDNVGVWEEDFELASFIIGEEFTKEEVNKSFGDRIKWFCPKKIWIVDFCNFQYGFLYEENIKNKPHQSYIALLKKHSLWIEYVKTIQSHKEKDTDKDKDIDKDKEKDFIDKIVSKFVEIHGEYEVVNRGKEREMAGKILGIYKKKYPESDSDETLSALQSYFEACINIKDDWLRNNMSLSIIVSKFNEINKILKNGSSKNKGATPYEIANAIAKNFAVDYKGSDGEHETD
jgi:hypothetical protein